jgi:hypothetical protein
MTSQPSAAGDRRATSWAPSADRCPLIEYLPLTPELARRLASAAEPGLVLPFGAELWAAAAAKAPDHSTSPPAPASACTAAPSSAPAG